MNRDEFRDMVQRRAQVDTRDQASVIIHTTLSVLGRCISKNEAEDIASYLPETFANTLASESEPTEAFSADEFSERVHRQQIKEECFSVPPTDRHVRAVLSVISTAIPDNTLNDVRNQLPADFDSFFESTDDDIY